MKKNGNLGRDRPLKSHRSRSAARRFHLRAPSAGLGTRCRRDGKEKKVVYANDQCGRWTVGINYGRQPRRPMATATAKNAPSAR